MAERQIIVRIGSDGSIHAETMGIQGEACLDYVEILEELLEAQSVTSSFTPDYATTNAEIDSEVSDELHQRS